MRRRVGFVVLSCFDDLFEHSGTDGSCRRLARSVLLNPAGAVVLQHRQSIVGGTRTSRVLGDGVADDGSLATAGTGRVRATAEGPTRFTNFYEYPIAVVAF